MSCCGAGGDGGVVFPAEETYVPRFLDLRGRVGAAAKRLLGVGVGAGGGEVPPMGPTVWHPLPRNTSVS